MKGPGTVNLTVLPNMESDGRSMALTIAGTAFMVTQSGRTPCTFSIAPESKSFGSDAGSGQVQVATTAGCEWTAASSAAWITTTGSAQGSGAGVVSYSVAANGTSTSLNGTMTIAARTFTATQAGKAEPAVCDYSVAPVAFEPCMPAGRVTATLTTQASCSWTVDTDAGWLSVPNGKSGKGPGTIAIAFSANYDASREGTILVRWPTPTAGQNIHVEQAGCLYAVTQASFNFTSAAATASFTVRPGEPTEQLWRAAAGSVHLDGAGHCALDHGDQQHAAAG
jgi:hypothetical protein